ncbi:MAG: acetyl-CoA carboxylase, carboxyltransferase subunit beta [Defluviitaleaceae bacterium]|nr:acetyl-CoA carboxylase, carboxyltransferase subunit beta [Defluviitaleaceae bacterium]
MNNFFKDKKAMIDSFRKTSAIVSNNNIPEGLYEKCPKCSINILKEDIVEHSFVCNSCGHHFRLRAKERLNLIIDEGTFKEYHASKKSKNPLEMPGYSKKLEINRQNAEINEAVVTGIGKIEGYSYAIAIMDSYFLMGSMGSVVGEKITSITELATKRKLPLIIFSASGGARMQEGILSLMQMVKTSAAIGNHSKSKLLFISVITNPTTGGVSASFSMLGDIIISEPGTLIGFAGPRVIEQTIGQKLPEGFQRAEFLKEKGFLDMIVHRKDMKSTVAMISRLHELEQKI